MIESRETFVKGFAITPKNALHQSYEHTQELYIDDDLLNNIMEKFSKDFEDGLSSDPEIFEYSPIKMLPTYLSVVPDGSEQGRFFAIDLGGTNLRFFEIDVVDSTLQTNSYFFTVPHEAMTGTADDLFGFIANVIKECLIKVGMINKPIDYFGFTFSFPCRQTALNKGYLIKWTKGYTARDVVNKDVVELLQGSCRKIGVNVKDFVLINDTTGTLLCGAFEHPHTVIGIINGTGTNMCYIERTNNVHKISKLYNPNKILINTEWGAFGDNKSLNFIRTKVDHLIDDESVNPGQQIFEKVVSGMYLGEIARIYMVSMASHISLFRRDMPFKLLYKFSFPTELISLSYTRLEFVAKFHELYDYKLDDGEYLVIADICDKVSLRSALLTSAGLAAIIKRINQKECVIAADGSMFKKHPKYVEYVTKSINKLLNHSRIFKIVLTDDGSGKGAALAACVASSEKHKQTIE